MDNTWIYKPVIFFGKRIYVLFAAVMSVPVWLASHTYLNGMSIPDDEAVATGITMCFFAGIFTGRYIAGTWAIHTRFRPRPLITGLLLFVIICLCWLFIHADFPIDGRQAINLLLYWLPFVVMSLGVGMLIKSVRALAAKQMNEVRTAAAQSESELRLLQSQLSPHFLFNTLNNMYGLSLTQHEKVPPLLLRLSDLLRYSVYGANEIFVPLKDEVAYISNYIEFEKIRLGERLLLETDIEAPAGNHPLIAPMLLIVFIENAFKHARNTAGDKIYISISLKTWHDLILFSVKNSPGSREKRFDRNSGFGLDNVRKRLELLYPGAYELEVKEDDRLYSVVLHLKKKDGS